MLVFGWDRQVPLWARTSIQRSSEPPEVAATFTHCRPEDDRDDEQLL